MFRLMMTWNHPHKGMLGTIITIVPSIPWWGQFHVIASPNVGSLPVKRVSIQKKERKKGMIVMIVPGIPLWGWHHEPECGQFSCK